MAKFSISRVADAIYRLRDPVEGSSVSSNPITVVCISDTHNLQPDIPAGDLLLHAGDLTAKGTFQELQNQIDWLDKQTHRYKIVIAGNHDFLLDPVFVDRFPERIVRRPGSARSDLIWKSVIYLQDESYRAVFPDGRRLNIYGSPWTPQYGNWAFQHPRIRNVHRGVVPPGTDILLTHGPPKLYLDSEPGDGYLAKGCPHLLREIWRMRGSLKLVLYGHIHAGYGTKIVRFDQMQRNYDSIRLGASGVSGLFMMALSLLWSWLSNFIGAGAVSREAQDTIRLANAAVKTGPREPGPKQPLIFQI